MLKSITLEYAESGSITERLDAIQRSGFHAVNIGTPQCLLLMSSGLSETQSLKSKIHQYGLNVDWLHAPHQTPLLYAANSELFHLSVGAVKTAILIASELEARSLIVHPFDKQYSSDVAQHANIEQLAETLSVLVGFGRILGVEIAIENIDEPHSATMLDEIFNKVDGLKFCLDTGHAQLWEAWDHYLPRFIDKVSALHIHDNHGETDEHLIPGDGIIDFVPLLRALKSNGYSGYLGIECLQRVSSYQGNHHELANDISLKIENILKSI